MERAPSTPLTHREPEMLTDVVQHMKETKNNMTTVMTRAAGKNQHRKHNEVRIEN